MLYLYNLKNTAAFVIRKNTPLETETPTWSSKNCKPFTEVERRVIAHSVEGTLYKPHLPLLKINRDSSMYGEVQITAG